MSSAGSIISIASAAAWLSGYPLVAYKTTKAGIIAYTEQIAAENAEFGVRANVILPGLMDTPMAVDTRARAWGKTRAEIAAARAAKVPLRWRMGTAWDVANAALFLARELHHRRRPSGRWGPDPAHGRSGPSATSGLRPPFTGLAHGGG